MNSIEDYFEIEDLTSLRFFKILKIFNLRQIYIFLRFATQTIKERKNKFEISEASSVSNPIFPSHLYFLFYLSDALREYINDKFS